MRYRYLFLIIPLLLTGCWDERLFKNISAVTLAGVDGVKGDITGYYLYTEAAGSYSKAVVMSAHGISPRDVRQHAELKVEQSLDLSMLSTFLMTEKSAKENVYEFIDVYYRDPLNPVTAKMAVVSGELESYFEAAKAWEMEAGEFYRSFIKSLEENSFIIPQTVQSAGIVLYSKTRDLALPYLGIDEKLGKPKLEGLALFTEDSFNGTVLPAKDSMYVAILNDTIGSITRVTYMYEDEPVTIRLRKSERDIQLANGNVTINFDFRATIGEYPPTKKLTEKLRASIRKVIEKKMNDELSRVMKELQQANSDVLGIGELFRAYEPATYHEPWHDFYPDVPIRIKVDLSIEQTGVIQ